MRIWDIDPGYLNRQSLLGEHRELHGIVSIIVNGKRGYSRHPETLRWMEYGWGIKMRHRQIACEMALRGYRDKTPVGTTSNEGKWPPVYLDSPSRQMALLKEKTVGREPGRIPLPANCQQLWAQYKYSILARNPGAYKEIGRNVAGNLMDFEELSRILAEMARERPAEGGIRNAVQHMWGYVSGNHAPENGAEKTDITRWPLQRLLSETQKRAMSGGAPYLVSSTALGELMAWLPEI